jgi:hypothetical protein
MKQSIEGMSDSEIVSFLNEYKKGVDNKILDFNNEYDFSDEALFNIIVAVEYLVESALNPNADALFSDLFKKAEIELKNRLGILPEVD